MDGSGAKGRGGARRESLGRRVHPEDEDDLGVHLNIWVVDLKKEVFL